MRPSRGIRLALVVVITALLILAWGSAAQAQQFDVSVTPNNFSMLAGGQQMVTVSTLTNAQTPASATSIRYDLQITSDPGGQNVGILTDTPKTTFRTGNPPPNEFPPVTINISVPLKAPPGAYSGSLRGHYESSPGNFTDFVFAIVQFQVTPAPGFSFSVSNSILIVGPSSPATTTITTHPDPGFNAPVNYQFSGAPSFMTLNPPQQVVNTPYPPLSLQISVNPSDPAFLTGTFPIGITATGGSTAATNELQVTVTAPPPDFSVTATPTAFSIVQEGVQHVIFTASGTNGFNGPITITAAPASNLTITPSTFTIKPGGSQDVAITAAQSAPAGPLTISFSASATVNGVPVTKNLLLSATITQPPDFTLTATITPAQIAIGSSGQVDFTATGSNGFNQPIQITAPSTAGLTFTPSTVSILPGGTASMIVTAGTGAPTGPLSLSFTATSGALHHDAPATVLILPAAPAITSITPPGVVRSAGPATLRVGGINFASGATIINDSPFFQVLRTTVISSTLADVVVAVRGDADLRQPYFLRLRNPDGGETAAAPLFVYDQDAIGAPLAVRAAAIVSPIEGTLVAGTDALYPRGLVATSGSGILHGEWRLDGIGYETFDVSVSAGMPVEVRSRVRLPIALWGEHQLTLALATRLEDLAPGSDRVAVSPSITLISTIKTATRLTIFDPPDRTIIGSSIPEFRWSMVPGASGYRIDIGTPEVPSKISFRTADSSWTPTRAELRRIGSGIFIWSVRAIFPGDVAGEPSAPHAIVILPEAVALKVSASSDARVAWSGGSDGVLYRIEVLDSSSRTMFQALAVRPHYQVPFLARRVAAAVRVMPMTLEGQPLGKAAVAALPSLTVAAEQTSNGGSVETTPTDGGTVASTQPRITAAWTGAVAPGLVTLFVDTMDVTPMADVKPTSILYDSILPLTPGAHTARLTLGEKTTSWKFSVAPTAEGSGAVSGAPLATATAQPAPPDMGAPHPLHTDYTLAPNGTITWAHHQDLSGSIQVSGQGDITTNQGLGTKFTGDLAWQGTTDPGTLRQESRNWVARGKAKQKGLSEEATFGYTTPDFTSGAEFLTSGLAQIGTTGKLTTAAGTLSYYQPVNTTIHGVLSGNEQNLRIRSAAFTTPAQKPFHLSVIGLQVTDPGKSDEAGSELRTVGLFGLYNLSASTALTAELAHGSVRRDCGRLDIGVPCGGADRSGDALRLGVKGAVGSKTTYAVSVRHVGANFVNPANRGFTIGGVADRSSIDLNLGRSIRRSHLNVMVRRQEGGRSHDSTSPRTDQTGANVSLFTPISSLLSFNASGNYSQDRGKASETFFQPRTSRSQRGVTTMLSETLGNRYSLSEMLSYKRSSDHVNPLANQTSSSANLTFNGTPVENVTLSANASMTRAEGSATIGTTDNLTISLQPIIAIPEAFLSFQPRIAYNRSKNNLTDFTNAGQQYSAIVQLSPSWMGSFLSAQASANWNRNASSSAAFHSHQFTRDYQASMDLQWGGLHAGSAATTPSDLPGLVPQPLPASQQESPATSH
jgi:hypothetical protein